MHRLITVRLALLAVALGVGAYAGPAVAGATSGTARLYFVAPVGAVAPGSSFTVEERVTVTGDSANVVQTEVGYPSGALSYLAADGTGSPFDSSFFNLGGGGRTYYVAGVRASGISGDVLVNRTTFRAGCTPGTPKLSFVRDTSVVSGVTNSNIPLTKAVGRVTIGALDPSRLCVSPSVRGQNGTSKVTLNGSGFTSESTVHFNGAGIRLLSRTILSSNKMTVKVRVPTTAALGTSSVSVANADGSVVQCSDCFTVTPPPNPPPTPPPSRGGAPSTTTSGVATCSPEQGSLSLAPV